MFMFKFSTSSYLAHCLQHHVLAGDVHPILLLLKAVFIILINADLKSGLDGGVDGGEHGGGGGKPDPEKQH